MHLHIHFSDCDFLEILQKQSEIRLRIKFSSKDMKNRHLNKNTCIEWWSFVFHQLYLLLKLKNERFKIQKLKDLQPSLAVVAMELEMEMVFPFNNETLKGFSVIWGDNERQYLIYVFERSSGGGKWTEMHWNRSDNQLLLMCCCTVCPISVWSSFFLSDKGETARR